MSIKLLAVVGALSVCAWLATGGESKTPVPSGDGASTPLKPLLEPPPVPELAILMGTLQTLTHKLALSADAGNAQLTAFYLHESMEQIRTIQQEAPEYENLPIAVLMDRLALPAYSALQKATAPGPDGKPAATSREVLLAGLDDVIQSCNQCHTATQHGFIQITRGTEVNPFNQSFKP